MPRASENFPIGIVNNKSQESIRPQNEKPLIVRCHFQDEQKLVDSQQLSRQINERLRHPTASHSETPPFVFIDADDFPDAYQLAGRYRMDAQGKELVVTKLVLAEQGRPQELPGNFRGDNVVQVAEEIVMVVTSRVKLEAEQRRRTQPSHAAVSE